MPENMNISVNGQSQVPPGFRFHPTEEELLNYYLKKKVTYEKIDLDVIRDVDLNKLEPWDIQETCKIGTTPQNDWYFFSHKDKKYPTGTRTNRATAAGFWKATGRDKIIFSNGGRIGMRKTLVFYKGRAPHGQKSDWIMHEYRLDDTGLETDVSNVMGEATQEDGWVVCRIFKKKNLHKTLDSPMNIHGETSTQMINSRNEGGFHQILRYMGSSSCKEENESNNSSLRFFRPTETDIHSGYNVPFTKLPHLESTPTPNSTCTQSCYQPLITENEVSITNQTDSGITTWAALDRLVASQLNGQTETSRQLACFTDPTIGYCNPGHQHHDFDYDHQMPSLRSSSSLSSDRFYPVSEDYNSEVDLWNFTRSSSSLTSSDSLCNLSSSIV